MHEKVFKKCGPNVDTWWMTVLDMLFYLLENQITPLVDILNNLIDNDFDDIGQSMNSLYQEVNNSQKSKCIYYKD